MSLKKRLVLTLAVAVVWFTVIGIGYYHTMSRYLEHYRVAEQSEVCCSPSVPVVESERLIAFREQVKGDDWHTFSLEDEFWGEVLAHLGFSSDMEGVAQFLAAYLPPFDYLNLRSMVSPIVSVETRKETYLCSDDGLFHINADGTVGLLFLSDEVTRDETVHYFYMTDEGLRMGALMRLSEKRREEIAKALNFVPKPRI